MKRGIFILCLAIYLLFTLSSVCAGDVNDTLGAGEHATDIDLSQGEEFNEISGTDGNQAIGQTDDVEVIGERNVGTFTELSNNITAHYGGTLELDRDYEYDGALGTSGITISESITIDGKGHTIDAKGKSSVFFVTASGVTIKNLTFKNGRYADGDGGAAVWTMLADNGASSTALS